MAKFKWFGRYPRKVSFFCFFLVIFSNKNAHKSIDLVMFGDAKDGYNQRINDSCISVVPKVGSSDSIIRRLNSHRICCVVGIKYKDEYAFISKS